MVLALAREDFRRRHDRRLPPGLITVAAAMSADRLAGADVACTAQHTAAARGRWDVVDARACDGVRE